MIQKEREEELEQKPVANKEDNMFKEESQSIECILEEDDESNDLKRDLDEENSSNNFSEKASELFFTQISKNGKNKVNRPVTKTYYGKRYVVGMMSQQDQELSDDEEKPIHYYPPKLILLNFPQPHNYDSQKQLLLIENSQFDTIMEEISKQDCDLTTCLEKLVVGSSMTADEKNSARCFWFEKFFDFAMRYPPCCMRVKKFWEWVFMLNPQSNFKWRFKAFSLQWIELMTSYIEFRELFSLWLESFEKNILDEISYSHQKEAEQKSESQKKMLEQIQSKFLFNKRLYGRYLKELLNMKNKSSITAEDIELREDMQDEVLEGGVVIKPEGYKDSCNCKRSERDLRIGMIPKLNKIKVKNDLKLFTKQNRQLKSITDMFTYKQISLDNSKQEDEVLEEGEDDMEEEDADGEEGDEDDDNDYDDEINEYSQNEEYEDSSNKESENNQLTLNQQHEILTGIIENQAIKVTVKEEIKSTQELEIPFQKSAENSLNSTNKQL